MKIIRTLTDEAILHELGNRLERRRLNANLTQAALAEQAGVSKRTLERIESGHSTDFLLLLRILRALNLGDELDRLVPDLPESPMALLKYKSHKRQRVGRSRREHDPITDSRRSPAWKWKE